MGGGMGMGMGGEGGGEGMDGGYGGGGYGGGMGMGGSTTKQSTDLVIWKKASQDELINSIRLWRGSSPTIYEILYTQENMWILEGIMRIIAKTNEGAKANFQASIKEIEFIRIGRPAVGRAGSIDTPNASTGGGMGGYGGMGGMGEAGMGGEQEGGSAMSGEGSTAAASGGGEEGEGASTAIVSDPAAGRYVDSTYAPITGEDLRTKMQSEDPQDAYFAVAKRVPVRLRFVMDVRKVPQFLTDCGNADLMLEIRQARIGKTTPAPAGGAAMGGGSMGGYGGYSMDGPGGGGGKGAPGMSGGGGMDAGGGGGEGGEGGYGGYGGMMGGGMGGMMGGGMGGMMGMGAGGVSAKPSWEMPVEVYGVIYLYNPVSIKRLGLDKVTENTELSDKVETPAANPEVSQPQAPVSTTPENGNVDPNSTAPNPANAGTAPAGTPAAPAPADTPAPAGSTPAPGPGPAAAPVNPNGAQPAVNP